MIAVRSFVAVLLLAGTSLVAKDLGCEVPKLVSTGAPAPQSARTLAIRWTGYSNFELAYGGQVILLDAYFDRGSFLPPLGFSASEVKKAEAILIGHGHFDHMSDAAQVATQTGAVVVGAALTTDKLRSQNLNEKQIRTVTGRGDEHLKFGKFDIEPILGRHGQPPANITKAFTDALRAVTPPVTPEDVAAQAAIRAKGTSDPRIVAEGTIAYLITLDNGFRIYYRDSGGAITDFEKAAMQKVGRVDIALAAVAADVLDSLTSKRALEQIDVYKPDVYIPAHYDSPRNGMWRPTDPVFQALKDAHPDLITIAKQYREPICFNTDDNVQRKKGKR